MLRKWDFMKVQTTQQVNIWGSIQESDPWTCSPNFLLPKLHLLRSSLTVTKNCIFANYIFCISALSTLHSIIYYLLSIIYALFYILHTHRILPERKEFLNSRRTRRKSGPVSIFLGPRPSSVDMTPRPYPWPTYSRRKKRLANVGTSRVGIVGR